MNISNEYIPVLLSTILVDTITGCNLYVKNDENNKITYILYCTGTNAISQDKISGLKKIKSITYIYMNRIIKNICNMWNSVLTRLLMLKA